MKKQIILLRGVTPTGKNKVPMALLRVALEEAGLENVRTYIQSGNVLASTGLEQSATERLVHEVIKNKFGGDLVVFARSPAYFKHALQQNPFKSADTGKLYFTFLAARPDAVLLQNFLAPGYAPDKIEVIGDIAYIVCATRYSDSKLNNAFIERKLKVSATTRVYNTLAKLVELSGE
ncbi:MAG: DUF1697 domain-containing protein [Betaproteobacteria bacterium]|nr:DUF1697 domain-containing protein [Betaproteobacteria bacterium]